jgi:hypothetical protein
MEFRSRVLVTLASLVAIAVFAATVATYRIAVLSADLAALLELDLPLERAAGDLHDLALQRTAVLEAPPAHSNRQFDTRIRRLSDRFSSQLDNVDALVARPGNGAPEFASLHRGLETVRRKEAAFRAASEDAEPSMVVARSRAIQRAAADLASPSTNLTDRAAARTTTNVRLSPFLPHWRFPASFWAPCSPAMRSESSRRSRPSGSWCRSARTASRSATTRRSGTSSTAVSRTAATRSSYTDSAPAAKPRAPQNERARITRPDPSGATTNGPISTATPGGRRTATSKLALPACSGPPHLSGPAAHPRDRGEEYQRSLRGEHPPEPPHNTS